MRKRNLNISFRVTEDEKVQIEQNLKANNVTSISDYLRTFALEGKVLKIDMSPINECNRILSNIGNNINQIAKKVNTTGEFNNQDLFKIQEYMLNIRMVIFDAIDKIRKCN